MFAGYTARTSIFDVSPELENEQCILALYYAYTSVLSVITFDRLGRCFNFVYIYACIAFSALPSVL